MKNNCWKGHRIRRIVLDKGNSQKRLAVRIYLNKARWFET